MPHLPGSPRRLSPRAALLLGALSLGALLTACSDDGGDTSATAGSGGAGQGGSTGGSAGSGATAGGPGGSAWPAGAMVAVTMKSTVGVLLDEFPAALREGIAAQLIAKPASFWQDRAKRQAGLTGYRLVFRTNYHDDPKDALPIAPDAGWAITLAGSPTRGTVGAHDLVKLDYTLTATLLSDATSPGVSEPALADVGGTWDEPFELPVDPELLFQRTRFACLDEGEFPPNSVDSEEVDSMYDQECGVEPELSRKGCHQTELPTSSCVDALDQKVGRVTTSVHYERLAYDAKRADAVRIGAVTAAGADMTGIEEEFADYRVIYRYIPPSSCTLVERCVGAPGWRRLLQFSAADKNVGQAPLDIGAVDYFNDGSVGSQLISHHVYEWSDCHEHYHFMHYGTFSFGDDPATNKKRGFCLQATNRFTNNEYGALTNPYLDCGYQGVGPGWGDEYRAGLECQWLDVTGEKTASAPVTRTLAFASNPDGFLCEGTPIVDDKGQLVFTPSDFKTLAGEPVDKPSCSYTPGWDANNVESHDATVPLDGEGYVTAPCDHGQIGPLRNCGLQKAPAGSYSIACTAGASVTVTCSAPAGSAPQLARACDWSAALATGIPCTYQDSLANGLVPAGASADFTVTCPAARDATEPGGKLSLYTGPLFNDDAPAAVTCTVK